MSKKHLRWAEEVTSKDVYPIILRKSCKGTLQGPATSGSESHQAQTMGAGKLDKATEIANLRASHAGAAPTQGQAGHLQGRERGAIPGPWHHKTHLNHSPGQMLQDM